MQLSFRLDKRPGESHLALDGKKEMFSKLSGQSCLEVVHMKNTAEGQACATA